MTIKEISEIAGVSKTAVSLVLNDKPGISVATRVRIMKIVEECGYTHRSMVQLPNKSITRNNPMTQKIIRLVAYMKHDIVSMDFNSTSFFSSLIQSIENYSRMKSYSLSFAFLREETMTEELQSIEKSNPSSGIILIGTNLAPRDLEAIGAIQPKFVVIDTFMDYFDSNFIVMDNLSGAASACKYLASLGHTRIGYVESSIRLNNFELRKKGFIHAMNKSKIQIAPEHFFSVNMNTHAARAQFLELMEQLEGPLPTAIFCECDYIAIGIIQALQKKGIRVPEDVSVIGFDDVYEASIIKPGLTTVSVDKDYLGSIAVSRLTDIIENGCPEPIKMLIATRIVKRKSCGMV